MAFPADYSKYQEVTIDHTKVPGDLTDYIVYINLADLSKSGSDIFDTCLADGGDIRASKSDGVTELPIEVVSINTTSKTGEIHVKFTGTLSSIVDTVIRIYYNGVDTAYATTATYGRNAVWSNYLLVAHMNQDPTGGGTPIINSTGDTNGSSLSTMDSSDLIAAKIGNGLDFDGVNDEIRFSDSEYQDFLASESFSISLWLKSSTSADRNIFDNRTSSTTPFFSCVLAADGKIALLNREGNNARRAYNTWSVVADDNAWHHCVIRRDGSLNGNSSAQTLYFDGAAASLFSNTTDVAGTGSYSSGSVLRVSNGLNGPLQSTIDEFRLTQTLLSANWAITEYNNQNSPSTFYSTSNEIVPGITADVFDTVGISENVTVVQVNIVNVFDTVTIAENVYNSPFLFGVETFEGVSLPAAFDFAEPYDGGSITLDTTSKVVGANSVAFSASAEGGATMQRALHQEYTELYVRLKGFIPTGFTFPIDGFAGLSEFMDNAGVQRIRANIEDYPGSVRLTFGGDVAYTNTSVNLPRNQVFTLQFRIVKSTTVGRIQVWLDNDIQATPDFDSGTVNTGAGGIKLVRPGLYYTPGATGTYYLDDISINTSFMFPGVPVEISTNDTITLLENVTIQKTHFVNVFETVLFTETTVTNLTTSVSVDDTVLLIEDVVSENGTTIFIFDTVSFLEDTNANSAETANIQDVVSFTENVATDVTIQLQVVETLVINENFLASPSVGTFVITQSVLNVSEDIATRVDNTVFAFDTLTVSEVITTFTSKGIVVFDTLTINESTTQSQTLTVQVSEIVPILENIFIDFFFPVVVHESLLSSDQFIGSDVYLKSVQTAIRRPRTDVTNPTKRPVGSI